MIMQPHPCHPQEEPLSHHPQKIVGLYLLMVYKKEQVISPRLNRILLEESERFRDRGTLTLSSESSLEGGDLSISGNSGGIYLVGMITCTGRLRVDSA